MRNIELKARLSDWARAEQACRELGALPQGELRQKDTYFKALQGRLKLRECDPGHDYWVYYLRSDQAEAKACDYIIEPAAGAMASLLAAALGVVAVVEKARTLYLWRNVRIHLDRVQDLGEFIEFEAVLSDQHDDADGYAKLAILQNAFGIEPSSLIQVSYLDLVLNRQ